jgi:hypothetical protein
MADVAPPPYVSPVATPGDKKTLTKAEEDNLVVALKSAFANIAGASLEINNLFNDVSVALAGLKFVGVEHDLYKDWNALAVVGIISLHVAPLSLRLMECSAWSRLACGIQGLGQHHERNDEE